MGKIKLLIMDVDGTLTDGKIYMSNDGEMFKVFDIKDGCGIHDILPALGIVPVVLTVRQSRIVEKRCKELGIEHCYQGIRNKIEKLQELATNFGLKNNEDGVYPDIAYVGDDIIDLPCMKLCGIIGCPKDAVKEVIEIADFVSERNGGDGAVREFIEWISNHRVKRGI